MSWCGLARNLKSVPWFRIQRARLTAQFKRAEIDLVAHSGRAQFAALKERVAEEYAAFQAAVATWNQLREQFVSDTRQTVHVRWERSILQSRLKELEHSLRLQISRMRVICGELA